MKKLANLFLLIFLVAVTFTWDMPTVNEDGTPINDLAGAKIYCGNATGVYNLPVDVGNVSTYTDNVFPEGDHYCAMTAYDTSGNESAKSADVFFTYRVAPGVPTNLRVTF